ncbi:hypothetical protein H7849_13400 [Alloacidobacterium dinghuense]|uniref:Uncharacterized protein n=1 Tax=Alloacidobacterium dinghuense TaxID=2763107 RepID=A0A7G8BCB9_9BACT|nr:hypothetical protein [Alloacidobacterium dinghuense]QNI30189.1 hypothetical protein H7849_13400 [Alloacidobacterium dinghuense]
MIPQAHLTFVAPIATGRVDDLRQLLLSMNQSPGVADPQNALIPFGSLEELHFARLVILEDQTLQDIRAYNLPPPQYPVYLAFFCDFDGSLDAFLPKLVGCAHGGLTIIFEHCDDFSTGTDLLKWMKGHHRNPATSYINWLGRTMLQVREEEALRLAIRKWLNADSSRTKLSPRQLQSDLRSYIVSEQTAGRLSLTPDPATPFIWELQDIAHLIAVPLLLILLLPLLILYAPIFIIQLRRRERTDPEIAPRPTPSHAEQLGTLEDYDVTNQFSAFGSVKPGLFRRWALSYVLWIINYTTRHIFNRGRLARVTTIHFARWVFLDDKKRLFFASNYDGSLDSYMDDFIDKVAFGLNVVFSNGIGYPTTNWLVLGGAKDEQKFKYFIRRHELPTEVWYNGHPGLTALGMQRNTLIRQGLENPGMPDSQLQQWVQLL